MCIAYVGWATGQPYWCEEHSCGHGDLLSSSGNFYKAERNSNMVFTYIYVSLRHKLLDLAFKFGEAHV